MNKRHILRLSWQLLSSCSHRFPMLLLVSFRFMLKRLKAMCTQLVNSISSHHKIKSDVWEQQYPSSIIRTQKTHFWRVISRTGREGRMFPHRPHKMLNVSFVLPSKANISQQCFLFIQCPSQNIENMYPWMANNSATKKKMLFGLMICMLCPPHPLKFLTSLSFCSTFYCRAMEALKNFITQTPMILKQFLDCFI